MLAELPRKARDVLGMRPDDLGGVGHGGSGWRFIHRSDLSRRRNQHQARRNHGTWSTGAEGALGAATPVRSELCIRVGRGSRKRKAIASPAGKNASSTRILTRGLAAPAKPPGRGPPTPPTLIASPRVT